MKSCTIFVISISIITAASTPPAPIPAKFLGKWELVRNDDNFDKYLEAKGYNWLYRKLIGMSSWTVILTKKSDNPPVYHYKISADDKESDWDDIRNGKEFEGEYLDDHPHKITFTYDPKGDKLSEKHVDMDSGTTAIYDYLITKDGQMVVGMEDSGIVAKRFYKKIGEN
ncbi:fatty acid-binding protein like protein 1 [Ditylenchus destructor]|uniref:Fatty acid-binding protein like protein 1 n=1 Tax=Ditylenchus destructor TaxID=166010 RepID=A0AAD4MKZ4_9BILA|nr:fatty acid-binding protein like protein 1 [Ditylenchus destructor]